MYALTDSNLWVGLVSGMRSIPILILPIFAGPIVDRLDKRKLLAFVRVALAIVSIVQAILIALDIIEPWHMLALALAAGTVVSFAMPAFWAYLADLIPARSLSRATALVMMGQNAGEMTGPVIVGWIIASAGADLAYAIIAAIYLLGAIFILNAPLGRTARVSPARGGNVRRTKGADRATETEDRPPYYESLKQGIAYARRSPVLPWLFVMNASNNIFGVAIFPLMPEYATKILDVGAVGFGVMSTVLGLGLAIGSIIIAIFGLPRRIIWIIIVSSFVWDFAMIGFGFSRFYPSHARIAVPHGHRRHVLGERHHPPLPTRSQRRDARPSNVPIRHRHGPLPPRLDLRRNPLSPNRQRNDPNNQRHRRHPPSPPSHAPSPRPATIVKRSARDI